MNVRVRLFIGVSLILLIGALISYFLPKYLVDRDIDRAAEAINQVIGNREKAVIPILDSLRVKIQDKISLNLLWTTIFGLAVALFLLAKLSKKMTYPIVKMAEAAELIGQGHYDDIQLPDMKGRNDEMAILAQSFDKMRSGLKEREIIRGVLNKVVSKEIAAEILKNPIELGGEERMVTILFSDIRGFTKMTEKMAPQKVMLLINDYLSRMCAIIDQHQGVVDKFVGDEIMALFGAPVDISHPEEKALLTALEMMDALKESGIEIGIGIHKGLVVAGNQGSENRLNYTVLGANVNLASRLCSEAKSFEILVTEPIVNALKAPFSDQISYKKLLPRSFKGFQEPTPIYQIFSQESPLKDQ